MLLQIVTYFFSKSSPDLKIFQKFFMHKILSLGRFDDSLNGIMRDCQSENPGERRQTAQRRTFPALIKCRHLIFTQFGVIRRPDNRLCGIYARDPVSDSHAFQPAAHQFCQRTPSGFRKIAAANL
jgi:hypothetical protein